MQLYLKCTIFPEEIFQKINFDKVCEFMSRITLEKSIYKVKSI